MADFNLRSHTPPLGGPLPAPRVLGTDLDGTLIPLPGEPDNQRDLEILKLSLEEKNRELVFATGRHLESVLAVMESDGLPRPRWIVCDVGATICRETREGYRPYEPYQRHLAEIVGKIDRAVVEEALTGVEGITPQEGPVQGPFKISYYCEAAEVRDLSGVITGVCAERGLPFACMSSVDPFDQRGLLDLLPDGISKAYALIWLSSHADFLPGEMVFAGDSGNDHAALTAGFRAVAVGNMEPELAETIEREMGAKGWADRFHRARARATSGVLEGCRHFGLI